MKSFVLSLVHMCVHRKCYITNMNKGLNQMSRGYYGEKHPSRSSSLQRSTSARHSRTHLSQVDRGQFATPLSEAYRGQFGTHLSQADLFCKYDVIVKVSFLVTFKTNPGSLK